MGRAEKSRRPPRKPQDDTTGPMRLEGAEGGCKRTPINIADRRGKVVFKVSKILAQQTRNKVVWYHVEWVDIPVSTWEPIKHMDNDEAKAAIKVFEEAQTTILAQVILCPFCIVIRDLNVLVL